MARYEDGKSSKEYQDTLRVRQNLERMLQRILDDQENARNTVGTRPSDSKRYFNSERIKGNAERLARLREDDATNARNTIQPRKAPSKDYVDTQKIKQNNDRYEQIRLAKEHNDKHTKKSPELEQAKRDLAVKRLRGKKGGLR